MNRLQTASKDTDAISSSKSTSLLPAIRDIRFSLHQSRAKEYSRNNEIVREEIHRLNCIAVEYGYKLENESKSLVRSKDYVGRILYQTESRD